MISLNQDQIRHTLSRLKAEHSALDRAIQDLYSNVGIDQIRIQRMKKRKLAIKDEIALLESMLLPDIIA